MYPSVAEAFPKAIAMEGTVRHPYLDRDGWVTTAQGYKVDDNGQMPPAMLALPWHYVVPGPMGTLNTNDVVAAAPKATQAQIRDGWQRVKARQDLKGSGGDGSQFANLTNLRLDDAGILASTLQRLSDFEKVLRISFPRYDTMQADAQMAILNMAWGMGPYFRFPKFSAAINSLVPDYDTAAAESSMKPYDDPAVQDHNALSQVLLGNAKRWQSSNLPPDLLWWRPASEGGSRQPGLGGGTALATAPPSYIPGPIVAVQRVGGLLGKLTLGLLVFGFGWLGVSAYRAHQRGEPWTSPVRKLGTRLNRAEQATEAKIEHAVKVAEGKA
jgi:hypothetical protein